MLGKLTYKTKDDVRAKDLLLNMYNNILDYNRTQSLIGLWPTAKRLLRLIHLEINPNCVKSIYLYVYVKYLNGNDQMGKQLALKAQILIAESSFHFSVIIKVGQTNALESSWNYKPLQKHDQRNQERLGFQGTILFVNTYFVVIHKLHQKTF